MVGNRVADEAQFTFQSDASLYNVAVIFTWQGALRRGIREKGEGV